MSFWCLRDSQLSNTPILTVFSDTYTSKEFDELCFDFGRQYSTWFRPLLTQYVGIELDEDVRRIAAIYTDESLTSQRPLEKSL